MQSPIAASRSGLRPFICRGCLRQRLVQTRPHRRLFSSSPSSPSSSSSPAPFPPRAGFAALPSRRLVSVSGPDAAKFLQGMITASIPSPGTGPAGFYAAFLTAQGRVLHDVFVYPVRGGSSDAGEGNSSSFLIEVDAGEAVGLQALIRRYKLRAKFDVRVLSLDERRVWQVWNDDDGLTGVAAGLQRVSGSGDDTLVVPDTRAPGLGWRVISPGNSDKAEAELEDRLTSGGGGLHRSTEAAYTVRRYLAGVAEGPAELPRGQALPHEGNLDVTGAIDFRKGCYVGQELTIRTQHRGVVRKRVLPCVLYSTDNTLPPVELAYAPEIAGVSPSSFTAETVPGETSIGRANKSGRSAGKWLRGVGNIGLALCRLEIMTDVELPGEMPSAAYSPEDEFVLRWGDAEEAGQEKEKEVKIKAFVPAWLREGLSRNLHSHAQSQSH